MCRNIKTLHNFDPPATVTEMEAAALQFVRKVSGSTHPSKVNEDAFNAAVAEISQSVQKLLGSLVSRSPAKNREVEAEKSRARAAKRFGPDTNQTAL